MRGLTTTFRGHDIKVTRTERGQTRVQIWKNGVLRDSHAAAFETFDDAVNYAKFIILNSTFD